MERAEGIQVIARAAAILRALAAREGQSLGGLAGAVGLPRSTVQRIVAALAAEGLVAPGPGGIALGPGLAALTAPPPDVVTRVRPLLARLAAETGETADLSVLRDGRMVFLDQVPGTRRLRAVSAVGEAFPLATTANGRAVLALLPRAEALALARAEWAQRGGTGDEAGLSRLLDRVQAEGLALDRDEHTEGLSALGLAFRDGDRLYALSVPVPSARFAAGRASLERALREAAAGLGGAAS